MNKDEVIVEVSRRNAVSVTDALRRMTAKIEEQQKRVDALNGSISTLISRIEALETANAIYRATNIGSGPTVKG
jgi:hypothetical protein